VVRQLTLPWAALIGTLEQAATREVAILQLQPDAEQRLVRLSGEARDREAMFQYLRRLSAAPGLGDVHLVSHQVQLEDPQRPIQFAVQATLKDAR
jgi:Tfp pilus assembly protein PilN